MSNHEACILTVLVRDYSPDHVPIEDSTRVQLFDADAPWAGPVAEYLPSEYQRRYLQAHQTGTYKPMFEDVEGNAYFTVGELEAYSATLTHQAGMLALENLLPGVPVIAYEDKRHLYTQGAVIVTKQKE
jgi:hypothetical protein